MSIENKISRANEGRSVESNNPYTTEVVEEFNDKILEKVLEIFRQSMPEAKEWWTYKDDKGLYERWLHNPNNILIVLKFNKKDIVGYTLLRPHNDLVNDLEIPDPLIKEDPNRYYIENIEILPEHRKKGGFPKLAMAIIEESTRRGVRNFSLHARVTNGLSQILQKVFGEKITQVRRIDNFFDYGDNEPSDYIEATV